MKKMILITFMCLIACLFIVSASKSQLSGSLVGTDVDLPFYVYKESSSAVNHGVPSGWMGDHGDLAIDSECTAQPKVGKTCIKITYSAAKSQNIGWAGIYWLSSANNWGNKKTGYNITGAKKLKFYAKGDKGREVVEFKIGGVRGEYADTTWGSTGSLELSKKWKEYEIDLEDLNLEYINGVFCVVFLADNNPKGLKLYIDKIVFE